ncbi:MAG: hypothetical protein OEN02_03155 [Gammaproteobacteria bacterium]|nr:hypothetical protein [Gammaproteobacteria bacterium]MDH3467817.1 hypothetical protein [Gammaproteobacteria bacterium]
MKPKKLGIGDKPGSPSADQLGLLESEGTSNSMKLRGETSTMKQQPTIKKSSISSDRGSFKCK